MSSLVIRAVEDPRTLDKVMYVRPPTNICSFAKLVHMVEKKTGRTLKRHYVSEQEIAKKIQGNLQSMQQVKLIGCICRTNCCLIN
jgi:hypothetical protein